METLIRVDQDVASERRVLEHSETGAMTLLSIMFQGMKLGERRRIRESESTAERQGTTLVVLHPKSSWFWFRDQTIRIIRRDHNNKEESRPIHRNSNKQQTNTHTSTTWRRGRDRVASRLADEDIYKIERPLWANRKPLPPSSLFHHHRHDTTSNSLFRLSDFPTFRRIAHFTPKDSSTDRLTQSRTSPFRLFFCDIDARSSFPVSTSAQRDFQVIRTSTTLFLTINPYRPLPILILDNSFSYTDYYIR